MKTRCLALFVALLTVAAPIACGDTQTHRQAAEELLQSMNIDVQMKAAVDQILALQIKQRPALMPYKEVMRKFFAKYLSYAALKDDLVKIYTDEFDENELRQIVKFYKTPAGKKMIARGPALMAKGMQLGVNSVQKHQDELKKMIEDESKKQKDKL